MAHDDCNGILVLQWSWALISGHDCSKIRRTIAAQTSTSSSVETAYSIQRRLNSTRKLLVLAASSSSKNYGQNSCAMSSSSSPKTMSISASSRSIGRLATNGATSESVWPEDGEVRMILATACVKTEGRRAHARAAM